MKTSRTTFETELRTAILDIVYRQWTMLGIPFGATPSDPHDVIDTEALLWCSLEFLATEPRLHEGVVAWLARHDRALIRRRLRRHATANDPRTLIWQALDGVGTALPVKPDRPCHGLTDVNAVVAFADRIEPFCNLDRSETDWIGAVAADDATLLVRTREFLGAGVRPFILVYLLGRPDGALVRDVTAWSGYQYRAVADALARWASVGVVQLQHGTCRLRNPSGWLDALDAQGPVRITDWFSVFGAAIRLLRAVGSGAAVDGAVVKGLSAELRAITEVAGIILPAQG